MGLTERKTKRPTPEVAVHRSIDRTDQALIMFIVLTQDLESRNLQSRGQAAVSLSSLRLLQNQLQEAEALADLALTQRRTDPQALVCLVSHTVP